MPHHAVVHLGVEAHVEPRTEFAGAKNPHRVFPKANVGVANGAKEVVLEVGNAADEIDYFTAFEIVEQPVDCEIAANRVLVGLAKDVVVGDEQIGVVAFGDRALGGDEPNRLRTCTQRNVASELRLDDLVVL